MGETCTEATRVDFDRTLKMEFHGTKVTSGWDEHAPQDEMAGRWRPTGTENGFDGAWRQDRVIKEAHDGREQESHGEFRIS